VGRLILLLGILFLLLLGLRWFQSTPPAEVARRLKRAGLWLGGGLLVFLAASGRLPALFALLGALAPFLQRLLRLLQLAPLLQRLLIWWRQQQGAHPAAGQTSRVTTRFLVMELDHDTGAMRGEVLVGRFQGRTLASLSLEQLLELHAECAADPQSAAVLAAYLDREQGPDWREQGAPGAAQEPPASGPMTREQAWEILGLEPGASRDAVLAAHRRLMQRLHPDRGGSNWLAAQINRAKDVLLEA
jgi:DnaJ-domain-containing protein 1